MFLKISAIVGIVLGSILIIGAITLITLFKLGILSEPRTEEVVKAEYDVALEAAKSEFDNNTALLTSLKNLSCESKEEKDVFDAWEDTSESKIENAESAIRLLKVIFLYLELDGIKAEKCHDELDFNECNRKNGDKMGHVFHKFDGCQESISKKYAISLYDEEELAKVIEEAAKSAGSDKDKKEMAKLAIQNVKNVLESKAQALKSLKVHQKATEALKSLS